MKKISLIIIPLFLFSILAWVYFLPFLTVNNIKDSLVKDDKMAFNAHVDFSALQQNLEHELSRQLKQKFPDLQPDSYDEISKKAAEGVSNSTGLFGSIYFVILRARHESVEIRSRYLSLSQFHVSFHDNNRPFLYPDWILCRHGVLFWKLCELSLPNRMLDINQKGTLDNIFKVEEKAQHADTDFVFTDSYDAAYDDDISLIEVSNILDLSYKPLSLVIDAEKGNFVLIQGNDEYKVTPKSVFSYKKRSYLIIDKIKKENGSFPDCHACTGNISVIRYKVDKHGIEVTGTYDDVAKGGVWGNSGTVFPVEYKNGEIGFAVVNGSMWQGHAVDWVDAYQINNDGIKALPELSQKKEDDSGAKVAPENQ